MRNWRIEVSVDRWDCRDAKLASRFPLVFFIFFLLICTGENLSAQSQTFTAKIIDVQTSEPLEGANIFIENEKRGGVSDENGFVKFHGLKDENINVHISYVGYADTTFMLDLSETNTGRILSLRPIPEQIAQIIITSSRTSKALNDIPARAEILDAKDYQLRANTNIDDLLGSVAGVVVNRSWGIFSKNTSVTMRGLESAARTLILLDGVPMNKLAGGPVNWSLINPEQVERLEVIKGPASTLYGANAVGGAINIITKKATERFEGVAKAFYASFDTWGSSLSIAQNLEKNNKGLSYTMYGFYRSGEGYYFDEGINFDDSDEKTFLEEYNLGGNFSYRFNPKHKLTLDYKFHDDFRGDGKQVYEEDGSYYSYTVNFGQANYQGKLFGFDVNALGYVQDEFYYRQNESLNASNEYRLYETNSVKQDFGVVANFNKQLNFNHELTFGIDLKSGFLHSVDDYMTSTDSIDNQGRMDFVGVYVQDEMKYLNEKLRITAGIRADRARFYNGVQSVQNPSKVTGFDESFIDIFHDNNWVAISPKLAARYKFTDLFSLYASVASGFNPPKIDDLCRSGKITKGFKLANPELKPEILWNYETGLDYSPSDKIKIATSVYYSRGYDFHNLVGTGDTVDTGGAELKPVLRKLNISEAEITGVEFSFSWQVHKNFRFVTNYSYTRSIILDFDNTSTSDNFAGNRIIEVPPHNLFAGLFYTGKLFDASLDYTYTDAIWVDIENTQSVEPYDIWNCKVSRNFGKHWNMSITIQNLLDNEYIDRKERKAPGRFSMVEVAYRW